MKMLPKTDSKPIAPAPRLVLFDLDDTLCDYAGARAVRLRRAFALALANAPAGLTPDLEAMIGDSLALHPHAADHFPDLLSRYGIDDPDAAEAAMIWYRANRFHSLELFTDAVTTLEMLRQDNPDRRIGLVTNGPADIQRDKITLLAVEPLIDFIVISGEFGAWKPDPAIFAEALRLGEARADEAVFIGDSAEHDIAGAQAAGIRAIWMNRSGRPWSYPAPPPDYEVASLTALRRLLGDGGS